ncbi:MAG: hypothetical protein JNM84_05185 [Planctomycetes bacterium]|nr:hypothetical protein [Planctomycetota bacterium]
MRFRAFLSLALYALAFVLGPGLHHVLPASACTDCVGEHRGPSPQPTSCCGHDHAPALAEQEPAPGEAPRPAEEDHEHCPDHCGVCRVVHGTAQTLPELALAEGLEALAPHVTPLPASEPRAIDARPRAARAPPLLG